MGYRGYSIALPQENTWATLSTCPGWRQGTEVVATDVKEAMALLGKRIDGLQYGCCHYYACALKSDCTCWDRTFN